MAPPARADRSTDSPITRPVARRHPTWPWLPMELGKNEERQPWFIDAWAVHDGKLFASRRRPNSMSADVTVFMTVPDLEPIPIGRLSTAMRATRSGFQEGFRDAEGEEVPFQTLAQVQEFARRAFLGSGLGPGSPGAAFGVNPQPPADAGPGSAYLAERWDRWNSETLELPSPFYEPPSGLSDAVAQLALASLLEWDVLLYRSDPEQTRAFLGWLGAVARTGVLSEFEDAYADGELLHWLGRFAHHENASGVSRVCEELLRRWYGHREHMPLDGLRGDWSRIHVALVPFPLARERAIRALRTETARRGIHHPFG